jgi:hypothetical protein
MLFSAPSRNCGALVTRIRKHQQEIQYGEKECSTDQV